ncbi:hypothetical protein BDBG_07057 [Blastomyces gilchristii SLH14081]|uniref:Uncharacterized protein n=1 Tax=Blastomyces gilchristii (strain SLH14081) TaxID=559298 RepID=A0A179UWW3_BLAGS|nr:uncharacterized protein BDBG_07057 [Blastomyces gilchristii SLH14081]OAT11608.1 hypothetical protein BDBG_07057 [Blastomyces gilchristii SLH14081]
MLAMYRVETATAEPTTNQDCDSPLPVDIEILGQLRRLEEGIWDSFMVSNFHACFVVRGIFIWLWTVLAFPPVDLLELAYAVHINISD